MYEEKEEHADFPPSFWFFLQRISASRRSFSKATTCGTKQKQAFEGSTRISGSAESVEVDGYFCF